MATGNAAKEGKYTPFTYNEKKAVSGWLGFQWSNFNLIYRASRDRFLSTTFHTKCDNKGPTLVIMYGSNGYVFGGYTSQSWTNTNTWIVDKDAFLFSLRTSSGDQRIKQVGADNQQYIYTGKNGPVFGNGGNYAILAMGQTAELVLGADGIFPASGIQIELSYGFGSGGLTNATMTGGATQLYDIEVYQVTESKIAPPDEAWRKVDRNFEWNPEQLKVEINKFKLPEELNVPYTKILLLGPVGSGKSSFFNTINSVYRGHVTGQAPMGTGKHSVTTKLRAYKIRNLKGEAMPFRICDTMGMEEDGGLMVHDIPYILDGNVVDHFQFNPAAGITPSHQDFKGGPKLKDKIHVACLVINATKISSVSSGIQEKLRSLVGMLRQRGVPCLALLTHIDQLCPYVATDNSLVFRSTPILDVVTNAAALIGISRSNILPVHNYENEIATDEAKDALALLALRQILRLSNDFFFEQLDIMGK